MKKLYLLLFLAHLITHSVFTQSVGIGTETPNTNAILEIKSFTKGVLFPRTSSSSRLAMPAVKGLFVYDTTVNQLFFNSGSSWFQVATGINHWSVLSNNIYNNNTANVGIGLTNPPYKFSVNGDAYITSATPTLRLEGDGSGSINQIRMNLPANDMDFVLIQFLNTFYLSRQTGIFGFVADLTLDEQGFIGMGVVNAETKLHIDGPADVGNGSDGLLQLGLTSGNNIGIDNNEIQARNNGTVSRLVLNNGGGPVQIGSAVAPAGYSLAVNGKVICEELKIQDSVNWPDYVFGENYDLKSFEELREFIRRNKHLPNIPDAKTVAENGIEIGDMQKLMMEKIEELTLYVLELESMHAALLNEVIQLKAAK